MKVLDNKSIKRCLFLKIVYKQMLFKFYDTHFLSVFIVLLISSDHIDIQVCMQAIYNFLEISTFTHIVVKGYFHLCPRMDFLQTLHINNSLYTNYENVFIALDS